MIACSLAGEDSLNHGWHCSTWRSNFYPVTITYFCLPLTYLMSKTIFSLFLFFIDISLIAMIIESWPEVEQLIVVLLNLIRLYGPTFVYGDSSGKRSVRSAVVVSNTNPIESVNTQTDLSVIGFYVELDFILFCL